MRRVPVWCGRAGIALFVLIGAVIAFGPREPADLNVAFDASQLGDDLDDYLRRREQVFSDITPGTQKRIVWAGGHGVRTPLAIVYLHGFSATSEEIRPVPDRVADTLGANLFFTRLAGHGRGGDALSGPTVADWMVDLAEALAIGARLGDKVVVISTSTGGTLAAIAATTPELAAQMTGTVFLSPNFGLNSRAAFILDLPYARVWGPWVAGASRSFVPVNAGHARYWTVRYPTTALFAMSALVRAAVARDFGTATVPALFLTSPSDRVVSPVRTGRVAAAWGGPVMQVSLMPGPRDDPYAHVLAGAILSPDLTDKVTGIITDWVRALP